MTTSSTPRVAVIMRTKDRAVLLARAVEDVLAQTYSDWSLVIVNDGGDPIRVDAVVAASASRLGDRVTVLHNAESGGMEAASNQGIAASESEFLVIHDDDDTWDPTFLEQTVAHLDAHPEVVGVASHIGIVNERVRGRQIEETGPREHFWPECRVLVYGDLLRTNRWVPIGYLYRRSLHDDLGPYREDLPVVGDWEFNLRTLARARVDRLPGPELAFWHHRGEDSEFGSSIKVAMADHEDHAKQVRDEALRAHVAERGVGDLMYLTSYLQGMFDHLHQRLNHQEWQHEQLEARIREQSETIARLEGRLGENSVAGLVKRGLRR